MFETIVTFSNYCHLYKIYGVKIIRKNHRTFKRI